MFVLHTSNEGLPRELQQANMAYIYVSKGQGPWIGSLCLIGSQIVIFEELMIWLAKSYGHFLEIQFYVNNNWTC